MPTKAQLVMIGIVSLISAFGGFVQWIRKEDEIRTRTELVKTVSTGIFTGVLAFVALTTIEIDTMLRYVLSGLASYIGGSLLDMSAHVATKIVERKVGLSTDTENAEQLDQIANAVQNYNKPPATSKSPVPVPAPANTVPELPAPIKPTKKVRPGEVPLAEYEAEMLREETAKPEETPPPEKPKRKRAPRKKKAETPPVEQPAFVGTAPDLPATPEH